MNIYTNLIIRMDFSNDQGRSKQCDMLSSPLISYKNKIYNLLRNFLFHFRLTVFAFSILLGGFHEGHEYRCRAFHCAFQLGVELNTYKERMPWQLDDFHQAALRVLTRKYQAGFFKLADIIVVKLVAVAVPFADRRITVDFRCF